MNALVADFVSVTGKKPLEIKAGDFVLVRHRVLEDACSDGTAVALAFAMPGLTSKGWVDTRNIVMVVE